MKTTMTLVALAIGLTPLVNAQDSVTQERERRAQQVNLFYQQAEQAYQDGDIEAAREALKNVFRLSPNHAQSYALKLKLEQSGNQFKIQARKKSFSRVMLKQIDFRDLELGLALETLNKLIMKETNDKVTPNFVIQDPSGTLKNKKVTLEVRNFPASEAIKFLMEATNATATYDEYSITVRPRGSAKSESTPVKQEKDEFDQ